MADEHTRKICDRFLERTDDVLFLAARDADNNVDETRFLDGQREIRKRRDKVREEVPAKIELGISILGNPLSDQDKEPESIGLSDLSLVDKEDFEEFLAVSEIVSELEPEFSEPLFALSRRFTYLANRELDTASIPIGPSILCNALADSLKGLQSDSRIIKRIYEVLHEVMSGNLGPFYEEINALLVEHGVLPVIEKDKPVLKKKPPAKTGFEAPIEGGLDDTRGQPGTVPEDDFSSLMPSPENYPGYPQQQAPAPGPAAPVQAAQAQLRPGHVPAVTAGPVPAPGAVQPAPPYVPGVAGVHPAPPPISPSGVVAAPPPISLGGAVAASPPISPGGVVAAPPPMSPGGAVAAPPPIPPGGVVAAPPPVSPGGVTAAPPPVSPGSVAAAPPSVPLASATAGGALPAAGGVGLPAGWVAPGVHYAAPSMQQVYSTAQTQMALRRQLLPDQAQIFSATVRQRGDYSRSQVVDGLNEVQQAFAETADPQLLDVDGIKQRITDALIGDGAPEKMISNEANDAIEVVANLFSAMLNDALVAKSAKTHLTRLQPSVHKAALIDSQFFESSDHPVRQVINRIAQVRDGKSQEDQRRNARVQELVAQVNEQFHDDVSIFKPMIAELDKIVREQGSDYDKRVGEVVESCEKQQQILEQRRGQSLEATEQTLERSDFPEEWHKWLERSKDLEVGERMLMNANTTNPIIVTLVWKEAKNNLFVFVDDLGNKASTLTHEQVAMYLRRGILKPMDSDEDEPAMERAMFGVVDRFHSQLEQHATRDPLTGFLNRKFFVEEIDAVLPEAETAAAKNAVICQISIENLKQVNDDFGVEIGDALIEKFSRVLREEMRGKTSFSDASVARTLVSTGRRAVSKIFTRNSSQNWSH